MLLEEYRPRSFLNTRETIISRARYPVIDTHTHFSKRVMEDDFYTQYDTQKVVADLRQHGVRKVVSLDFGYGEMRPRVLRKIAGSEDFFILFGGVDVGRFEEPGFGDGARRSIEEGVRMGMRGIKMSKQVGLGIRGSDGRYLRPDDERLSVIYETAAQLRLPVVFHIGDPRCFFEPVDRYNERYTELCGHPDWSFHDPSFYRFEQLMEMQEHMISSHPDTTFIIAHVGSWSENLRQVGAWLDTYPNMYVDIAARINELGRQPYTAKAFLERYSSRIFFGTDFTPYDEVFHPVYYRFLETADEYFDPSGEEGVSPWNIYGVSLSEEALQNIYYKNAARLFGLDPADIAD